MFFYKDIQKCYLYEHSDGVYLPFFSPSFKIFYVILIGTARLIASKITFKNFKKMFGFLWRIIVKAHVRYL